MPAAVGLLLARLLAALDAGRLLAGAELAGVLLRDELLNATELLERLDETTASDEAGLLEAATLELLAGAVALGLVPTKYRSGAAGVAMPSPRKKLVCGGWL